MKKSYCPCCFTELTANEICPGPWDCKNHGRIVNCPSRLTDEEAKRLREKSGLCFCYDEEDKPLTLLEKTFIAIITAAAVFAAYLILHHIRIL